MSQQSDLKIHEFSFTRSGNNQLQAWLPFVTKLNWGYLACFTFQFIQNISQIWDILANPKNFPAEFDQWTLYQKIDVLLEKVLFMFECRFSLILNPHFGRASQVLFPVIWSEVKDNPE